MIIKMCLLLWNGTSHLEIFRYEGKETIIRKQALITQLHENESSSKRNFSSASSIQILFDVSSCTIL